MKLIAAAALLLAAVAHCHHSPEHKLNYPCFVSGQTHVYDVHFNTSSGVAGMDPQRSRANLLHAELRVYAKSSNEIVLYMHRVRRSESLAAGSNNELHLRADSDLEELLKVPIKAILQEGEVKSYTLAERESLESAKAKRSVLRMLQLYLDREVIGQAQWPATYNRTSTNRVSRYSVTSSPWPHFPAEQNVINVTRADETYNYPAFRAHHNFDQWGCSHNMQKQVSHTFVQQHNLKRVQSCGTAIDEVRAEENHAANLYDQTMLVNIRSMLKLKKTTTEVINAPTGQKTYQNLNNFEDEINEQAWEEKCYGRDPRKSMESAKALLQRISQTVASGDISGPASKEVGQQLIQLQKDLVLLKKEHLKEIHRTIPAYNEVNEASEQDKIKRQIWYDILPVLGSKESVSFIVKLIRENMDMDPEHQTISLWEAKTILESLPENIIEPTVDTIQELIQLTLTPSRNMPGYPFFHSASHIAVARVIRSLCPSGNFSEEDKKLCPKTVAKTFVKDIAQKLERSTNRGERIIYIETLAQTGLITAIPYLAKYANYVPSGKSPRTITFERTSTLHAMHHLVEQHYKLIREIALPIFLNATEPTKVRNAAFGLFVRAHPTFAHLQTVAERSWHEPSDDVAHYVTRTMYSYGNSSLPCHQDIVESIRRVQPLMKFWPGAETHSKNHRHTIYDSLRAFGVELRDEIVSSNESFIPAVLYGALSYDTYGLRDTIFQYALNIQGLTSRNTYDKIVRFLGLETAKDIPKQKENEIFPEMDLMPHDPEFWRFVSFEKIFYATSYYYFDAKDTQTGDIFTVLKDQLSRYFHRDNQGHWSGHAVRVLVPSSHRTWAVGRTWPAQVRFQTRHPLLFSLKVKASPAPSSSANGWEMHMQPTVYYSSLSSLHILNSGDCKEVGTYHETKAAATYPIKIRLDVDRSKNSFHFAYSFPQLPKKIFTYASEAGTYAGKDRKTINTIPSLFEKKEKFGIYGLPMFHVDIKTEDIQFGSYPIPRSSYEGIYNFVKEFLNAGWRRKEVEISRVPDNKMWTQDTELKVHFTASRDYVRPEHPKAESDWAKSGVDFNEESLKRPDATEGKRIHETLAHEISHVRDEVHMRVEQVRGSTARPAASAALVYRRTLGGLLHAVRLNATAYPVFLPIPASKTVTLDYVLGFIHRPNEFKYDAESYGRQKGLALGAISVAPKSESPFQDPLIVAKALLKQEKLSQILSPEMQPRPSDNYFRPETHEQCLEDMREGKTQSVHCLKAIHEAARYNKLQMSFIWNKDLPTYVLNASYHLDMYLKHAFFPYMRTELKSRHEEKDRTVYVEGTYIDKMVDTPVFDFVVETPRVRTEYRRIDADWIVPVSSVENTFNSFARKFSNNSYPATCALMEKHVRTYDLKTFPLTTSQSCSYLLTAHCTAHKKFAVIAHPAKKEITMHIGEHTLVLTPGSSVYKVLFNNKEHTIKVLHPVMFDESQKIYAVANMFVGGEVFLEVHAKKAGIKAIYDGKNFKIQVNPRYKGELCGLCSEFDGEQSREFRAPDKCLYSDAGDFARANIVGQCSEKREPSYPRICDSPSEHENNMEPTLRRNMVLSEEDQLCFSLRPLPTCENGAPSSTISQQVELHCLPREDRNARKMVAEARRRVLGELETKRADITRRVEVAHKC